MPEGSTKEIFINNRYKVRESLGRGGIGEVLLVEDRWNAGHLAALKKLRQDKLRRNETANLRREFLTISNLSHPNLARALDFGRDWETGDYFFTSEYVPGTHLHSGLPPGDIDLLLEALTQVCRGLEFIHNHLPALQKQSTSVFTS